MGTIGPFGPETICILDRQCYFRINDRAGIQWRRWIPAFAGMTKPLTLLHQVPPVLYQRVLVLRGLLKRWRELPAFR